ncbi:sulfotransferase [Candidatus Micrarchaeota archaeon]|nr:sulfotransferase [Candidatus Micrarchaeota archaeon]MBD3417669.1 sulfotransferase [Candidatus Micrarchaeota archaeon]
MAFLDGVGKMSTMTNIRLTLTGKLSVLRDYPLSYIYAAKNKGAFDNVKRYCTFIGYPRSGHTLVGSLVDAHPNAIVAHELDALDYVNRGFSKERIFSLLLEKSRRFAKRGREWTGYRFEVPDQWHGKFKKLEVIGDKKGGGSTKWLGEHPELIDKLRKTVGVETKFIHVLRNPYDNITTWSIRRNMPLEETIERYFSLAKMNKGLKEKLGGDIFDIRHEDVILNPKNEITKMCDFLGLDATDEYLQDCSNPIFKRISKTRKKINWTPNLIEKVSEKMKEYPFLKGYSYYN